jgi:hypothetical protein
MSKRRLGRVRGPGELADVSQSVSPLFTPLERLDYQCRQFVTVGRRVAERQARKGV